MNEPLPAVVAALFPDPVERLRISRWLTQELEAAARRVQAGRITPLIDAQALQRELETIDFTEPASLQDMLGWTIAHMETGIVQMSNPRYFGLFNPGANFPSQCADRIAGIFNPQLASSGSSPLPVALEAAMIRTVAHRAGIESGASGHFATGGSESNYTALLCALTRAHPDFSQLGARAFSGTPVFYASNGCHIAWLKIAHQAGIGRRALKLVATDGRGRMDIDALARAIDADRRLGDVPVMAVATAGTTGSGMIDPLEACAELCAREGLWYHVDAAWGGGALASDLLRPLLRGIERADSITIDAHKWFATTMGCALYITRQGHILPQAFNASAEFMPSSLSELDPYLNSVQWSRRFLGLRLFLTLACAGWPGLGAHVERAVSVIERIAQALSATGWQIVNASPLAVLNVLPPAHLGEVRPLVKRVVTSGRAWVAVATFEGQDVVRICATNGETDEPDVDELVACLNEST